MARSIALIKSQILTEKANQSALSGATSTSQTAIYNLWAYVTAVAINLHEQAIDLYKSTLESELASSYVSSDAWLQAKAFEFQYSATVPQVVTLVNFAPIYNPINTALRIITRCSVKTTGQRIVEVKVAKLNPPVALSAPELSAFSGYLSQGGDGTIGGAGTGIGYAGVQFKPVSRTSDKLFIKATITYNGQYSSVIQTNVINAINNYLANIPFDGLVKVLSLVDAIQSVSGVKDIKIEDLAIRADATPFVSTTYLIQAFTQYYTTFPLYAGYAIEETTSGQAFLDQITFVAG